MRRRKCESSRTCPRPPNCIGHLIRILQDKAALAGISVDLVDERGTSSTCPACVRRIPKPSGRVLTCRYCGFSGHRGPGRGGHHRHPYPGRRTHHPTTLGPGADAVVRGGHAPSSRPAPARCRPVPT
ncbi:zinc ribbon domain-containing protein [Plantactinospora sp. DSM 117369]